jgi:acyl-CoA synthetase (AMP-forming)/AMP-acid ligase II
VVAKNCTSVVSQTPVTGSLGLLTSGTTGKPKCVKHSWDTLSNSVKLNTKFVEKRWLTAYPISHFAGLQVLCQSIINGGTIVIPQDFIPKTLLFYLANYQINYLNCTPTLMRQMLLSTSPEFWSELSLSSITLGGEVVEQSLIDLIKKYLPFTHLIHIYASTELGALIKVDDEKEGFPIDYIDEKNFKIQDGQLFVRPKSNKAMLGYIDGDLLSNGWFSTQDRVEIQSGRVKFLGRINNIINIAGYKVDPHIVEKIIRQLSFVVEVLVCAQANPITGYILKAQVQLNDSVLPLTARQEILNYCKSKLPYYMVPRLIEFLEHIKLTSTLKIAREYKNEK